MLASPLRAGRLGQGMELCTVPPTNSLEALKRGRESWEKTYGVGIGHRKKLPRSLVMLRLVSFYPLLERQVLSFKGF